MKQKSKKSVLDKTAFANLNETMIKEETTRAQWKLRNVILEHSKSQDFSTASREWEPVWYDEDVECESECICGKQHIKELNAIRNKNNGVELIVGSECIKYFIEDLDTTNIFSRLTEIKSDPTKAMTPKLLAAIEKLNILNDWDLRFYKDTQRKQLLSLKQLEKRDSINKKVIHILACRKRATERLKEVNSILSEDEVNKILIR